MNVKLPGVGLLQVLLILIGSYGSEMKEEGLNSVSVKWMAPIYSPGGYSSESMAVGMALDKFAPELGGLSLVHHGDSVNRDYVETKLSPKESNFL